MQLRTWWNKAVKTKEETVVLNDVLEFNDALIPVIITIEYRNGYRCSFTKKGISIRIPNFYDKEHQKNTINSCKEWAIGVLTKKPGIAKRYKKTTITNGYKVKTFDNEFEVIVKFKDRKTIGGKVIGNIIQFEIPRNETAAILKTEHISKLLAKHYQQFLQERLNYWNELVPTQHKKLRLKYNSSNWGSCSTKKNINLSTRLLLCPLDVVDYVIVHELCHLVQPNHSRAFWREVAAILPDFKQQEKWLKTKGANIDF